MEKNFRKKYGIVATIFLFTSTSLLVYMQAMNKSREPTFNAKEYFRTGNKYLVHSSKCKILNLDPWNSEALPFYTKKDFVPCSTTKPLTHVVTSGDAETLRIDATVESSYTLFGIRCCYSNVSRAEGPDPDKDISVSPCRDFQNETRLYFPVIVKCYDLVMNHLVYENAHASTPITKDVRRRLDEFRTKRKPPSVIVLGIDSMSRLNFHRTFTKTRSYLETKNWIEYKGYNKIGDNTFPNLMAILTGRTLDSAFNACNPRETGKLDECNFVWHHFRRLGYVTAYAEDEVSINTFNYNKKGFKKLPTDYYFRPYILATETLTVRKIDGMTYCAGPLSSGERILNLAKEFIHKFDAHPKFGFFWMNSFSHDDINAAGRMDCIFEKFFTEIHDKINNNTIVIFLSDHGMRFGDIRLTNTGWLEERLPFLYFFMPKTFTNDFPAQLANLKANAQKLTTPYDMYVTLQDVLVLSRLNHVINSSEACPRCKSMFSVIEDRSCKEAAIPLHWCTCTGYKPINPASDLALEGTSFAIDAINKIIGDDYETSTKCVRFKLSNIISSRVSDGRDHNNKTYLLLTFRMHPASVVEVTVSFVYEDREKIFKNEGDFSRLDQYKFTSQCVQSASMFCYCQWNLFSRLNFFNFWFEV